MYAFATGCAIVSSIVSLGAFTRQWGVTASLTTATALTALAFNHLYDAEEDCAEDHYIRRETLLVGVLAGSMVASLPPLWQALTKGGAWQNRAFLGQLVMPTLTLGTGAYILWKDKEASDTCWMKKVTQSACALTAALAMVGVGHVAASPTPVLGLALFGSGLWFKYRHKKNEGAGAIPSLMGIAAAVSLITTGLIGARYTQGTLFSGWNNRLITAGQGGLLLSALALLGDFTFSNPYKEDNS